MTDKAKKHLKHSQTLREAMHLQTMEDNPLDTQDKAMFDMFEREGWSPERRRVHILEQAKTDSLVPAAE